MEPETEMAASGFSLPEYLAILRRRRAIILQAFVLVAVIGVAQALIAKNVYQSSAKLLVEGPAYNLNTIDGSNPLSCFRSARSRQWIPRWKSCKPSP